MLNDKSIDAVLIATPEHWHARMVLDPLAAGKPHRTGFDTPESAVVSATYPEDFLAVFTIHYAAMRYKSRSDQMNPLDGNKARMDIGRETCRVYAQGDEEKIQIEKTSAKGFGWATDLHVQNFLDCCRKRRLPTAPKELGFQACLVTQLANASHRTGRRLFRDFKNQQAVYAFINEK